VGRCWASPPGAAVCQAAPEPERYDRPCSAELTRSADCFGPNVGYTQDDILPTKTSFPKSGETPVTQSRRPRRCPLRPRGAWRVTEHATHTCNAMEIRGEPQRRLSAIPTKPRLPGVPDRRRWVGYARTVTIVSVLQSGLCTEQSSAPRLLRIFGQRPWDPQLCGFTDIERPTFVYRRVLGRGQATCTRRFGMSRRYPPWIDRDIRNGAGFQAWSARSVRLMHGGAAENFWRLSSRCRE